MQFKLKYKDSKGDISSRDVKLITFGDIGFKGTCSLRGDIRSFKYDRILQCIDLDTGEFVENLLIYLRSNR